MSQHDYNIANGGGAAVRADLNNALLAILSQNAGATAPTTTKPFMPWYDTTTGVLKMRNAADTAWIAAIDGITGSASQTMKNRIINGAMMIDQRNAGASVTNSTGIIYTLDRWAVQTVGSNCVIQQVAGSTGNNKALKITGATGNTNTILSQKIEASNVYDLASQTVTVSFTLYGSGSGSVSVRFLYPTATDNFTSTTEPVAGTSVSFTTTATTYTVTRTLDANANKGLWVVIERGATGSGVTWSVENVQLEKGAQATAFDYRQHGTELALCQRYYQPIYFPNGDSGIIGQCVTNADVRGAGYFFPQTMRAAPTVTLPAAGKSTGQIAFLTSGAGYSTAVGTHTASSTPSSLNIGGSGYTAGAFTAGNASILFSQGASTGSLSSEL